MTHAEVAANSYPDSRPLHVRVRAIANRYDAMAIGKEKLAGTLRQDAENARRDARTLHDAADKLERA